MSNAKIVISVFLLVIFFSCISRPDVGHADISDSTVIQAQVEPIADAPMGVVLYEEVPLLEFPKENSRAIVNLFQGDGFECREDTAIEVINGMIHKYHNVQTEFGKTGWVRDDYVVLNAHAAAVLNESAVYDRPDIATTTDKKFSAMDFVAVKNKNATAWLEVIGKSSNEKAFISGWIDSRNVSADPKDISFIIRYKKLSDTEDVAERTHQIRHLLNDPQLEISLLQTRMRKSVEENGDELGNKEWLMPEDSLQCPNIR